MWCDCRCLSGHTNGAKLPQSRSVDKGSFKLSRLISKSTTLLFFVLIRVGRTIVVSTVDRL